VTYGYYFIPELKGEAKLNYLSDRYTDPENLVKLSSFWNLGLKITYDIDKYIGVFFELNNILNTKRFIWENYQEKPFDVLVGANFFFE
jgi:outer membrane receptor protein involved in Fe transport